MNYTVVVVGGVLVLSVIWFYFPKYGGIYWFTGPIRNTGVDISTSGVQQKGGESELQIGYEVNWVTGVKIRRINLQLHILVQFLICNEYQVV